jgi:ubiquinone/menaquinone biosynthesis C-methylase UbiE
MPLIPDLTDPRYLYEVGWFLYYEKYRRYDKYKRRDSFEEERLEWSSGLLDEVLRHCGQDQRWLEDKAVVSIGCGCTGELAAWPAAVKIGVDPLLYVYQELGMLVADMPGTAQTINLAADVMDLPLMDNCADLVVCRNALDHMPDPEEALRQIWRILKKDGALFLSVDMGGPSTPDEPIVFSEESLSSLLQDYFDVSTKTKDNFAHNWKHRDYSVRILARKKHRASSSIIDKEAVLQAYIRRHYSSSTCT